MPELAELRAERFARWCQTPATHIDGPDAAIPLIERVGIATLYPASPEIPNLYHAFVGDPDAKTDSNWASPSGQVYAWRWALGRKEAAFYTAIVRSKPTWISWTLLPAVLRLRGEQRTPDELYDAGVVSENAYRIAQALEASGGVLSTGELRKAAGFPTGKTFRAAYLKAVEELDTRLLLAKVFAADSEDMSHALIAMRYAAAVEQAEAMRAEDALHAFLMAYLPNAVYAAPSVLARHLKLDEAALRSGLDVLVQQGQAIEATLPSYKGSCYVWQA